MLKKIGIVLLVIGVLTGGYFIYKKATKSKGIEIPIQDETPPTLEVVSTVDSSDYWKQYANEQKEVFEFQLDGLKSENKKSQQTISWLSKNRKANNDNVLDEELANEIRNSLDSLKKLGY